MPITANDDNGNDEQTNVYITGLEDQAQYQNKDGKYSDLLTLFLDDIFKMYSQDEIENFRCIFDMFDRDRTGYVSIENLQIIIQSLERNPDEA